MSSQQEEVRGYQVSQRMHMANRVASLRVWPANPHLACLQTEFILPRHPSIKLSSRSAQPVSITSGPTSPKGISPKSNLRNSKLELQNRELRYSRLITSRDPCLSLRARSSLNKCVLPLIWRGSSRLDRYSELKIRRLPDSM